MKNPDLVSIIVPIYNVEKFLNDCLKSLAYQTYRNIEIIMVNDGSPDNSAMIAEKYLEKDQRFKLISQENRGLNMARKTGFENSTGKWIMFVDSDDVLDRRAVEFLLKACQDNQVEMSIAQYQSFTEKITPTNQKYSQVLLDKNQAIKAYLTDGYTLEYPNFFMQTAWGKLFSRRLIKLVDWDFSNYKINEDEFFSVFYYKNLKTGIVLLQNQLYFYRQNPNSITRQNEYINFYKGEKISRFELLKRITEARLENFSQRLSVEIWFWFVFHYLIYIRSQSKSDGQISDYEKQFWVANRLNFLKPLKKYQLASVYQQMFEYFDRVVERPIIEYRDFKFLIDSVELNLEKANLIDENRKIHQRNQELWQENNDLKIELEKIKSFRGSIDNLKKSTIKIIKR